VTFLSLLQIKYALDQEGRAVGEGCCGGKQRIAAKRTATYGNRLGSVGAVSDIVKNAIKCLLMPFRPSLSDTFSPRAKTLIAVTLFI
jgi:hypothetical protein